MPPLRGWSLQPRGKGAWTVTPGSHFPSWDSHAVGFMAYCLSEQLSDVGFILGLASIALDTFLRSIVWASQAQTPIAVDW